MIAICLFIVAFCPAIAGNPSKENPALKEELMFGHIQKMANGAFDKDDFKSCEEFLAKAEPADRPTWLTIIARYHNMVEHDPLAALATVGPLIIGEQKARSWQITQQEAGQRETAQKDKTNKTKQSQPIRLLVPFPPVAEWSISALNAECAVEAVRAHLGLKEYEIAMEQITYLGPKLEQMARVMAGECGGDLLLTMQRYDQATRFYMHALEWLNEQRKVPLPAISGEVKISSRASSKRLLPARTVKEKTAVFKPEFLALEETEQQYFRPFTQDERYLRERINESFDTATRLWDIERFGEDFVLYREAEKMRREQGRYLEAYLAYQETEQKYAGTMYGEAARAYKIKCLWALASPENVEQARQAVQKVQDRLNIKQKQLKAAGRMKPSAEGAKLLQDAISECERKLERMANVPLGKAAAEAAGQEMEKFISDNEFGLYRGDVIAAKADYCLECLYNTEQAVGLYDQALAWFNKAESMSVELDAFNVPEKSREISAPPPEMKAKDEWGNVSWSKTDGGKLFNQRTSIWYVPYHRMMLQTKKALCLFIMGKSKEALGMLNIILEVDAAEQMLHAQGLPNSYSRLKAEFEQGRMFATAEELKAFTGKPRTAIMVADYYYEIEQWKEAAERYRRIDREMRKDLNLKAQAYLDFMLANCLVMTEHNDKKALKYFSKFTGEYRNTPTWPRAMIAIFAAHQNSGEYEDALNTLKTIYRRIPDTEWGQQAYYHQGEFLYVRGLREKARKIFETCQKKYADTWLARGAGQYLKMISNNTK